MQPPRIEVIPSRPAVCRDSATSLTILLRITPPLPEVHVLRPPINLGIVLDRSGSMSEGQKMTHAREAAEFAVKQLLPTDRLSIVSFDNEIETVVPSAPVADKPALIAKLRTIKPRGSTALHAGWTAGANQVLEHVAWEALNRVLLLSDGLANVGVTEPAAIAADVRGMAGREVSTTTIGVGEDYNEDLLEAMARAGNGNYYYVQSPVQLMDIFQTELQGLMATTGRNVELSLVPESGITVTDVLNDLPRGPSGQINLPDLIADMPVSVVVRLNVAPRSETDQSTVPLCQFRLGWNTPTGDGLERRTADVVLELPLVSAQEWEAMPVDPAVQEQEVLLMAARARDEANAAIQQGDIDTARHMFGEIREMLCSSPATDEVLSELKNVTGTMDLLDMGDFKSARKVSHYRSYQRKQGRGTTPKEDSPEQ